MQGTNKEFPHVETFLNLVDKIGENFNLNIPPIVEIEKLLSLPPKTLGRTLAEFLQSHQLKPLITGPRRKQLHDSVHVLTGYHVDPIGEAEVQAFLLGSKLHIFHIILSLGLLGIIAKQVTKAGINQSPYQIWQRLYRAYHRGNKAQFDIDTWQPELQWNLPLTAVRSQFNIS